MKVKVLWFALLLLQSCITTKENDRKDIKHISIDSEGKTELEISFQKGKSHNNPSFALWIESIDGSYFKPVYVTRSVATGIYDNKEIDTLQWMHEKGSAFHSAALPYFFHRAIKSGIIQEIPKKSSPFPDAYTGATPQSDFKMNYSINTSKFKIMLEVNQSWDWNYYWTNNKYPDNIQYKYSSQPSVIYSAEVDLNNILDEYYLNPIGHGHFAGENGNLYTNLKTLTTALDIFSEVKIIIK